MCRTRAFLIQSSSPTWKKGKPPAIAGAGPADKPQGIPIAVHTPKLDTMRHSILILPTAIALLTQPMAIAQFSPNPAPSVEPNSNYQACINRARAIGGGIAGAEAVWSCQRIKPKQRKAVESNGCRSISSTPIPIGQAQVACGFTPVPNEPPSGTVGSGTR